MSILYWDKPKKAMSTEKWKESAGFDGGPPGGYVPNMSREDDMKWKAKITGTKLGYPQVEIRRGGLVIIVNLGKGYNYKYYNAAPKERWNRSTKGLNLHIASNGALQWTFDELQQFNQAVEEAKQALLKLEEKNKED